MKLFNIICNVYTLTPIDGGTKIQCLLESSRVVEFDSLSEVKQGMRNRYKNYTSPGAWGKKYNLVSSRTFGRDSYSHLVFELPVPKGVVGERKEFYITKAII